MRKILKFSMPVIVDEILDVAIPEDSSIIKIVGTSTGFISIWAIVGRNPNANVIRTFKLFVDGAEIPDDCDYVGSVTSKNRDAFSSASTIYHLFELKE